MSTDPARDATSGAEPVTALIRHEVRPEAVDRYERWLTRIMPIAAGYEGHAGVEVSRPAGPGPRHYAVMLRFRSLAQAQVWFGSDERRRLMAEAAELLVHDESVTTLNGLVAWFGPSAAVRTPRRWKQFVVTLAAIYPLTVAVPAAVEALQAQLGLPLPAALRQLVIAAGIVALMTWVVMPRAMRVLVHWLHR